MFESIITQFLSGFGVVAILVIAALGLAVIFGVAGVINMAHGEFIMVGAYTAAVVSKLGGNTFIAIPLAFILVGLIGLVIERSIIQWIYDRPVETLLATWGVGIALQVIVKLIFGPELLYAGAPAMIQGSVPLIGLLPVPRYSIFLLALAIVMVAVPGLVPSIANFSGNPFTAGDEQVPVALELLIPGLLAVLTQWGLVRRRYLRMAGEDDLTRWPWVTTVIAVFTVLNPFGLTFLLATFKQTSGDIMWQFMSTVTAGSVAALVVMAGIECYIRGRILRRRKNPNRPAASLQAGVHRA